MSFDPAGKAERFEEWILWVVQLVVAAGLWFL